MYVMYIVLSWCCHGVAMVLSWWGAHAGWPPRPLNSLAQHLADPSGLHFERDGMREQAVRFAWDPLTSQLATEVGARVGGCFAISAENQQDSGHQGYTFDCDEQRR